MGRYWAPQLSICRRRVCILINMSVPISDLILAVLGLHAIKDKPVVVNGKIEIRPVCHHCFIISIDGSLTLRIDDVPCFDL